MAFTGSDGDFDGLVERFRSGERQPASASKEAWVRRTFPIQTQSPEAWAAAHAGQVEVCGLHRYRYADPEVDVWMSRLGEILHERMPGSSTGDW